MRPAILQLDRALDVQPALRDRVRALGGELWGAGDLGPALRLWSRPPALAALQRRLDERWPTDGEPMVVFTGSGDFHHVTPLLLNQALAEARHPVTVVHFDNHPDWVRYRNGVHCGSWVGAAARLSGVSRVITIGVCSADIGSARARQADLSLIAQDKLALYAWKHPDGARAVSLAGKVWPTISAIGEAAFLDLLDGELGDRPVYITIDKDMLRDADAGTNWDQGQASLDFLIEAVGRVAQGRQVVGADICGDWSAPIYGQGLVASLLKRGEALLDQPLRGPGKAALAANERANLRLLELFSGISP